MASVLLVACGEPEVPPEPLRLVKFLPFKFEVPVAMVPVPGDKHRWFVLGQMGGVWDVRRKSGNWERSLLLDMSTDVTGPEVYSELGMLGIALYPRWKAHPVVFIAYTIGEAGSFELILSRFQMVKDSHGERIRRRSEQVLLRVSLPSEYHHGGSLEFGPDGPLYLGIGDGGDPTAGQDRTRLLGSIIRITVGPDGPYRIPADNPPVQGEEKPELFAWGLRNPWKFSFDRETKSLWAGDVGKRTFEEIDVVEKGKNYGWACYEGPGRPDLLYPEWTLEDESCLQEGAFEKPITSYQHPEGCSVTGGYVYRGTKMPGRYGSYIFADYCNGKVYGIRLSELSAWSWRDLPLIGQYFSAPAQVSRHETLLETGRLISSFAEGHDGELYLIDWRGYVYGLR